MMVRKNEKEFKIKASDFDSFCADLILLTNLYGALHHRFAFFEIKDLNFSNELLFLSKMKSAFANFKKAASIFDYIHTEMIKHLNWRPPKDLLVPEIIS